jgi:ribosomal protein L40E
MEDLPKRPDIAFCTKCGFMNPVVNKHCYACGGSLNAITCSYCSTINPHYAKYCGSCGHKLTS